MSINHTNCPRFKIKVITNNGVKLICPIDSEESIGTLYLNIQELYKDIMIEDHSQCQPFSVNQLQKYDYRLSRTQIVGDVLNDGDQLTCIIEQKVKASKSQIKKDKKLEKERKEASISKQKKIEEGEKTSQKTKQSKKMKTKLSDKVMNNLMVSLKDSFKPNQQSSLPIKNKQNDSRRESPKPTQYLFVEEQESPIVKEQNQPQSLLP